ncbi:hypothetical protein [Enterobacter hormaechei]|uniref:hypothetical protein n=1 Tax=Enterobacter hormaechei TaxID=158836 RepID=UPI001E4410B9|nr:hypothetical protein [Enterobacter hormaechei]
MSELTKEWLLKTIAELEEERDATPGAVNEDAAMSLAAMKIALASLEAEQVSINDDMAYAFHHALSDSSLGAEEVEEIKAGLRAAFANVTAPPAPVSDSLLSELLAIAKKAADAADECAHAEWSDDSMEHSTAIADWERRAAMLQGAEPVTTAYKLRDAVDTIRNSGIAIDGEKILAERDALNSPVIPDGWVAVPVEPTIAILDEFDSIIDYGAEDSKDAWSRLLAAAWIKSLPAAPQLEVK